VSTESIAARTVDDYAASLLARLADFFTEDAIQWPRRLWDVGSVASVHFGHETCVLRPPVAS
jgi:hypothetical protein